MEHQESQGINIELPDNVAQGIYSNLAIITHSSSEFILDFISMLPGMPKAKVQSRIILTPEHAKRLLQALQDNLAKFEQQFGPVNYPQDQPPMGFTTGEA